MSPRMKTITSSPMAAARKTMRARSFRKIMLTMPVKKAAIPETIASRPGIGEKQIAEKRWTTLLTGSAQH